MKPETKFKNRVAPKLKKIPHSYWIKTQMLALIGVPDFIGCVCGRFVAIELKADDQNEPTKLQYYVLNCIESAGGMSFVMHPGNAENILSSLLKYSEEHDVPCDNP